MHLEFSWLGISANCGQIQYCASKYILTFLSLLEQVI